MKLLTLSCSNKDGSKSPIYVNADQILSFQSVMPRMPSGSTHINLTGGHTEVVAESAASIADMIAAIAPRTR